MPKKIKLLIDIDADLEVIGISSVLKDYQLAFRVNSVLGIDLKRIDDFYFKPEKSEEAIPFSMYLYQIPASAASVCLLQNRNISGFMMPYFRQADYFIIIQNPVNQLMLPGYISKIKAAGKINTAFPLNLSGTKIYQAFAQDLELHLMEHCRNKKT